MVSVFLKAVNQVTQNVIANFLLKCQALFVLNLQVFHNKTNG